METLSTISDHLLSNANSSFDYPKTVTIDATSSSIELIGVHQLEHASDGMPFRWTGPDRHFSIQLFISRREPATFKLHFGKFFAEAPVEQLRAFVDGKEVLLSISGTPGHYQARGELAPREQMGGSVLTFIVPALDSPGTHGGNDIRLLGLQFIELHVASEKTPDGAARIINVGLPLSNRDEFSSPLHAGADRGDANAA